MKRTKKIMGGLMNVKVETTGYCGGDSGHGGSTSLSLICDGQLDMEVEQYPVDGENNLSINFRGDWELYAFIKALEFATKELKKVAKSTKIR